MQLPRVAKLLAVVVLAVGLVGYLVLLDLGVNAGRVHYGVSISGLDIGGRTFAEAEQLLEQHGEDLKTTPIVFGAEGFDCRFIPEKIGWGPQPHDTAETAMAVGRPIVSLDSLAERLDAWLGGVKVKWASHPDPSRVDRLLDECEAHAKSLGGQLDRGRLRLHIRKAIVMWPRPLVFRLPIIQ